MCVCLRSWGGRHSVETSPVRSPLTALSGFGLDLDPSADLDVGSNDGWYSERLKTERLRQRERSLQDKSHRGGRSLAAVRLSWCAGMKKREREKGREGERGGKEGREGGREGKCKRERVREEDRERDKEMGERVCALLSSVRASGL